jgi:GMP synthase (glutamine-hydrolysing)
MKEALKRLLIIQAGNKLPSLAKIDGDFSEWIVDGMEIDRQTVITTVEPQQDQRLPGYRQFSAVIISGSNAMITDNHAWMKRAEKWVREAVASGIPFLGICFGHQLLASALGGTVADNPNGIEVGSVDIHLQPHSSSDKLFADMPKIIPSHVSHRQSVLKIPPGAVHLASSAMDANHAFRFGAVAWGLQFHPEFTAEITQSYLDYYRPVLIQRGVDVDALTRQVKDYPYGRMLLRRFTALTMQQF